MPIAPLGDRDGRRTIDEQTRLCADLQQVGIMIRKELSPALQIDLAAHQVALAGLERGRLMEIMGTQPRSKPRIVVREAGKAGGAPVLAKFPNRPVRLRRRYKGKTLTARVRPDGSIRFAGEVFNTPSLAAHAAIGRTRAVNGWLFWTYERAPGDWVQLNELRK
jgi:hypothetical protein